MQCNDQQIKSQGITLHAVEISPDAAFSKDLKLLSAVYKTPALQRPPRNILNHEPWERTPNAKHPRSNRRASLSDKK
jgi:hypothetical protein